MKKIIIPPILDLILILVIGIFFAFFRLEQQYGFEFDQERDYNIVRSIVTEKKFTLIGPRVVSSAGFYLGPWYYYLNLPFYILFGGEPSFAAYFTGFINLSICLLIYLVLKGETKSRLMSLLAAVIWISSANKSSWNVTFVPLFFLGFLYFYLELTRRWRFAPLLFLTLVFSFSLHFHPQMIFLLPLWLFALTRHRLSLKQILSLLVSFVIPFLPLVLFDLRHEFVNSNALLRFLTQPSAASADTAPFRFLYSLRQFSTALVPLHPIFQHNLPLTGALLSAAVVFTFFHRRFFSLVLITLSSIFVLSFYKEPTWPEYYHYLAGFSLLLLVFIAGSKLKLLQFLLVGLTAIIVWGNYGFTVGFLNPSGYYHKKAMILYMLRENQPYEKLNIINDFRFGEGLGFSPIRRYFEEIEGEYHPTLRFYVSYAEAPKHNETKKTFGLYGVSKIESTETK